MAGTKEGGKRAAFSNIERHGKDFYAKIGSKGGKATYKTHGILKGFAANPELARIAGAKGGHISRRNKSRAKVHNQ